MKALMLAAVFAATATMAHGQRVRQRFDDGWKFFLERTVTSTPNAVTDWQWRPSTLAAGSEGAYSDLEKEAPADWKPTRAGVDTFGPRRGFNWYRTVLPTFDASRPVLHVDHVDDNAVLFLNGQEVGRHKGYGNEFDVDLSQAWKKDGPNQLVALIENTGGPGYMGPSHLVDPDKKPPEPIQAKEGFDDRTWRRVHLPHDFVVEGTFTPEADTSHGFLPFGLGWYRKEFVAPKSLKGKYVWIDFDGVFRNSTVWVNGHELGTHSTGYAPFRYDVSGLLNYGGRNTLAVRADATKAEGWWYEGGGIYRHVWLNASDKLHVAPDGLFVNPQKDGKVWSVAVQVELVNARSASTRAEVRPALYDARGRKVATAATVVDLAAGETKLVTVNLSVANPRLWSIEDPYLYTTKCAVRASGQAVDTVKAATGFRTLTFDAEKGFFLNGKSLKFKGTCNHQDFAGVGVAMPDRLLEWRIKKLKEMGSNAYRCSHNMVAQELLDACDRLGMLVMDENRHLGDAKVSKTAPGTPLGDLADLKTMIRRDRNHPSVVMWSMCNEEGLQGTPEGAQLFKGMRDAVLALDPSRPVTAAMNGGWGSGFTFVQDLQGINYSPTAYDDFHAKFPKMPLLGSETASEVGTRGEYANDTEKGYVSAYGRNAPPWAQPAEVAWKAVAERDFVMGGFVWTGFDYRGEPTPYAWPCVNSHFGVLDMCGFPKDTYWYYKAWWEGSPTVHLLPHWTWPDAQRGKPVEVWVQTNASSVELFLNGRSLGSKPGVKWGHIEFNVPYEPGTLEARGTMADGSVVVDKVETTGSPARLKLVPYWRSFVADHEDLCLVEVQVLDAQGRVVPGASDRVTFRASGAAKVVGVGNGDPSDHDPDRATNRRAFHGRAMVVVQAGGKTGGVQLTATAPGLKGATVALRVTPPKG